MVRPKKRRKRRMSMRKKVMYMQISAITLAIFILLLVGAAILTNVFGEELKKADNQDQTAAAGDLQEETASQTEEGAEANPAQEEQSPNPTQEIEPEEPDKELESLDPSLQLTISAAGDCTLGTDYLFDEEVDFNAFYRKAGSLDYFFQNVKDIFGQDDLTIVNMESVLTESNEREDKTFAFKGDPSYAGILTAGNVEAANLANNHSHDYGNQSYEDTISYLENEGISTFGYDRTVVMDVKGIKVGLVGVYELASGAECESEMLQCMQKVKDEGAQLIIVSFHWGTEKDTVPDSVQRNLAHSAIDHGAGLVLGHHPHVIQGIENYKGKNIVYSLANFCFGGNYHPSDMDTLIFQQTFTFTGGTLVEDNVTNIIPCSVSSAEQYNNYQPTPLQGEEAERVMQKIQSRSNEISN